MEQRDQESGDEEEVTLLDTHENRSKFHIKDGIMSVVCALILFLMIIAVGAAYITIVLSTVPDDPPPVSWRTYKLHFDK